MTAANRSYRLILLGIFISAIALIIVFADGEIDYEITSLFYDPQAQYFPARTNETIDVFLYRGMKLFMGGIFAAYLLWGLLALKSKKQGFTKKHLLAGIVGTGIIIGLVNAIKSLTGVECPWSTQPFGGQARLISLYDSFAGLMDGNVGRGRCFPAGHATGGLFLFAWAAALRDCSPFAAKITTGLGLSLGLLMGFTRVTQGAHFLSHVLWSVWLASLIAVFLNIWLDFQRQ